MAFAYGANQTVAMRIPTIRGTIDRRILVNFHIDPDTLARVLPEPFRPKLHRGVGIGGICLIRLTHLRPSMVPTFLGISSENAAHRIAVEWDQDGKLRDGVYIPRRDTSSRLNTFLGGWLFPGTHHHARFQVAESEDVYRLRIDSDDGKSHLLVEGSLTTKLPAESVFRSLREASDFFAAGSLGYSATDRAGEYDGLELRTFGWRVEPLAVSCVESSFFDDRSRFPEGSLGFDCALLMRGSNMSGTSSLLCAARRRVPRSSRHTSEALGVREPGTAFFSFFGLSVGTKNGGLANRVQNPQRCQAIALQENPKNSQPRRDLASSLVSLCWAEVRSTRAKLTRAMLVRCEVYDLVKRHA